MGVLSIAIAMHPPHTLPHQQQHQQPHLPPHQQQPHQHSGHPPTTGNGHGHGHAAPVGSDVNSPHHADRKHEEPGSATGGLFGPLANVLSAGKQFTGALGMDPAENIAGVGDMVSGAMNLPKTQGLIPSLGL